MAKEGIYITKADFNQLMKKIQLLEEYLINSSKTIHKSKWIKPSEAMEMIGCKKSKLNMLRMAGEIDWRYAGNSRGVMILRSSVEQYNMSKSTILQTA